jgi:hypothetical protein
MRHYYIPAVVSYNYTGESPNPLTLFTVTLILSSITVTRPL